MPQPTHVTLSGRFCSRAPGLCRWLGTAAEKTVSGIGRSLNILPVLEILGIAALVFMLHR